MNNILQKINDTNKADWLDVNIEHYFTLKVGIGKDLYLLADAIMNDDGAEVSSIRIVVPNHNPITDISEDNEYSIEEFDELDARMYSRIKKKIEKYLDEKV